MLNLGHGFMDMVCQWFAQVDRKRRVRLNRSDDVGRQVVDVNDGIAGSEQQTRSTAFSSSRMLPGQE